MFASQLEVEFPLELLFRFSQKIHRDQGTQFFPLEIFDKHFFFSRWISSLNHKLLSWKITEYLVKLIFSEGKLETLQWGLFS